MSRERQPIDEYTLAAFLSGTLSEERRHEVVVYLAENADARELLCMAREALEATEQPVTEPFQMQAAPAPPPEAAPSAPALRPLRPALPWKQVYRIAAAAMVIVVLGLGLRIGLLLNDTDDVRGSTAEEVLRVYVSTPALQFHWDRVEEAYYYRLIIWDVEAVEAVARHETKSTRLGRNDAFVLSLHHDLKPGRLYSARIDAMDVQNRLIKSSEGVDFSLQE